MLDPTQGPPPPLTPDPLAGFQSQDTPPNSRDLGISASDVGNRMTQAKNINQMYGSPIAGGILRWFDPFVQGLADPKNYLFPQNEAEQSRANDTASGMFGFVAPVGPHVPAAIGDAAKLVPGAESTVAKVAPKIAADEAAAPTINLGQKLQAAQAAKQTRMEKTLGGIVDGQHLSPDEAIRQGLTPNAGRIQELMDHLQVAYPDKAKEIGAMLQPTLDAQKLADYNTALGKIKERELKAPDIFPPEGRIEQADVRAFRAGQNLQTARAVATIPDATLGDVGMRTRTVTSISADDANALASRVNLTNPSDFPPGVLADLKTQVPGLPLAKMEPSLVHDLVAAKDSPYFQKAFAEQGQVISFPQQIKDAAQFFGLTDDKMVAGLARRGMEPGEATAFLRAVNARAVQLGREYHDLATSGADKTTIDAALGKWINFSGSVAGANSEAGRMLGSLRQALPKAMQDAVHQSQVVVPAAQRNVADAEAKLAQAQQKFDEATANAKAAREAAQRSVDVREKARNEKYANLYDKTALQYSTELEQARLDLGNKFARLNDAQANAAQATISAQAQAVQAATNGGVTADKVKAIASIDPANVRALIVAMRKLHNSTLMEMISTIALNNTFSGPGGLARSFLGAAYGTAEYGVGRGLAVAESSAISKIGQALGVNLHLPFADHELPALLHGMGQGLVRVPAEFVNYMKSGDSVFIEGGKIRGEPFKSGWAQLAFEDALRAHGGFHAMRTLVTKSAETEMLLANYAARDAGGDAAKFLELTNEYRVNPPKELTAQLGRVLEREKFLGNVPAPIEKGLQFAAIEIPFGKLGNLPIGRILFPALKFGYGYIGKTAEFLGGDVIRAPWLAGKALLTDDPMLARDYAREAFVAGNKAALSAGLWLKAYDMYINGDLIATDREGRGHDNSINLGGNRIDWKWLGPPGFALGLMAQTFDGIHNGQIKGKSSDDAMLEGLGGLAKAIEHGSFLGTLADVGHIIDAGVGAGFGRVAGDAFARMLIPNAELWKGIAQHFDDYKRAPSKELLGSMFDHIKEMTGIWESSLNPKLGGQGEPIPNKPEEMAPPKTPQQQAVEAFDRQLLQRDPQGHKILASVDKLSKQMNTGIEQLHLSEEEHLQVQQLAGTYRTAKLGALIQDPAFLNLPAAEQSKRWTSTVDAADKLARRDVAIRLFSEERDPKRQMNFAIAAIDDTTGGTESYSRGQVLMQLQASPAVLAAIDSRVARTGRDPLLPAYQLSAKEYIQGKGLVDQWLQAPAYLQSIQQRVLSEGASPGQLDVLADKYKELRAADERKYDQEHPGARYTPDPITYDEPLRNLYLQAAGGLLALTHERNGSERANIKSLERRAIETGPQNELWTHFKADAEKLEKAPHY